MAQNDRISKRSLLELILACSVAWSSLTAVGGIGRTLFEPQQQPPVIYRPKAEAATIDYSLPAQPLQRPLLERAEQSTLFSLDDFYRNPARYQKLVPDLTERDLATAVRVAYNEVGTNELEKVGPEAIHGVIWVMINRFKDKGLFSYADSITSVGLAKNQFQPVWPTLSGEPSYIYSDLFGNADHYESLPKKLLDAHIQKIMNTDKTKEEAAEIIDIYSKKVLEETLRVFAGGVPDLTEGAMYFKNACTSNEANSFWHNRTFKSIWGAGRADVKLWFTVRLGNHWYYTVVPKDYDEPVKNVPALC